MQSWDGWIKFSAVNGSPTYKHCPPATPRCQPSRTLPPGFNKNLILPAWTEALASTEINTSPNQVKLMPMLRPKQHLLCLRPQALHKLPNLGRCAALCQRCNNASREETRNTAIPLATIGIPFMPPLSTTTCLKKPPMPQMPQEAEMLHPNQKNLGVPGAPKTAAPTITQLPTALC